MDPSKLSGFSKGLTWELSEAPRQNRHARYNMSPSGKERRRSYRHDNSKHQTDVHYLARPFVAWDGEGITLPSGEHIYVMLANSEGGYLANPKGLKTYDILSFLLAEVQRHRQRYRALGNEQEPINVIYGGSYDFNMWLSDMPRWYVKGLYEHDFFRWGRITIQWRRGKSFYVRLDNENTNDKGKGITIYDVVSFFQCSFVKACDDYLGVEKFTHRDVIVENKALRSTFTKSDIPEVKRYNEYELENLIALVTELRERLNRATLRPRRWDGPGAVAAALLTRENVKDTMMPCPDDVAEAARFAYAGGRFEPVQYGIHEKRAYEYDVNSAYPFALQSVPNLRRGAWQRINNPDLSHVSNEYALIHVGFKGSDYRLPMPLFWRSYKGNIVYPGDGRFWGWYWAPDVRAALAYVARYGGSIEADVAHVFVENNTDDKPFAFIPELYAKRRALKKAHDGAHVGIKLGLNSLYGKLAQQVGAREVDGVLRPPSFHQIEWAGYVTSVCRSSVYLAAIDNLSSVIAYETDALFTTIPLDLPINSDLGGWEQTEFASLTYAQSGLYYGTKTNGEEVVKTRGVNRGTLPREAVETAMRLPNPDDRVVRAPLTTFTTAGLALQPGRWQSWRRWTTSEKEIRLEPQGKRIAIAGSDPDNGLARTFAARVPPSHSAMFPIAWVNPDPNMDQLSEMREAIIEWDGEVE